MWASWADWVTNNKLRGCEFAAERRAQLATLTSAPSKGPATWDKLYPHVRLDSPNWPRARLAVHRLRADPNVGTSPGW